MDLRKFLVTDGELEEYGVSSAPDDLTGTPAAQVKALFDRLPRKLAERLNGALETLSDESGGMMGKEEALESFLPKSAVTQTLGASADRVPSELAVTQAIGAAGGGDMLQAMYDTDRDGTVDRAAQAQNGLYFLTHALKSGAHTLTGTVPASGDFIVCFYPARSFMATHSPVMLLNDTVSLTLTSPGHDAPPRYCFLQGELAMGVVTLETATQGELMLYSTPPIHKTGGVTSGSIIVGNYTYDEGDNTVATEGRQVRNITLSTAEATGGANGDLWLQYEG